MKVYVNRGEVGDFKQFVRNRGEFLTFLQGINITNARGKTEIEPVYMPMARWENHSSQLIIVIGYQFPVTLIILQRRWPLIQIKIFKEDQDALD